MYLSAYRLPEKEHLRCKGFPEYTLSATHAAPKSSPLALCDLDGFLYDFLSVARLARSTSGIYASAVVTFGRFYIRPPAKKCRLILAATALWTKVHPGYPGEDSQTCI